MAESEDPQVAADPLQAIVRPTEQAVPLRGSVTKHVHQLVLDEIPKHKTIAAAIAAVAEAIDKTPNNVSALYYTAERKKRGGPARRLRRRGSKGTTSTGTRRPRSSTAERIDKVIAELETLRDRVEAAESERDDYRERFQTLQRLASEL